jgi:hypothetical protein
LDKKIIALSLIAVIAAVSTTSIGYYVASQPNQTQNNPSPTPTPTSTPTLTPTPTPTSTPPLTPSPTPREEPTEPAYMSKPSVPEFTLKYVDYSYDVPPTYGIDEYTGKTIVTKPGEHVDNRTIEITIKNQAFTPFTDASSGRAINLYYNIRYKGSFGQDWDEIFGRLIWYGTTTDPLAIYGYPSQDSTSQYTTVSYTLPWNVVEGQIDFQVQALKGYVERTIEDSHMIFVIYNYTVHGAESSWSSTQTITIP